MPSSENPTPLHSTGGAVAGTPNELLEPVARMLEGREFARRTILVVVYHSSKMREESAHTVEMIHQAIYELGAEKAVRLRVYSWQLLWFIPYLKGARRAPVVEIDGRVYSEGIVPNKEEIKKYIQDLLTR